MTSLVVADIMESNQTSGQATGRKINFELQKTYV